MVLINCGTAGGFVVTDTASIAAATAVFQADNVAADQAALVDYLQSIDPTADTGTVSADQPDGAPVDGVGD